MNKCAEQLSKLNAKVGLKGKTIDNFGEIKCPICGENMMIKGFDISIDGFSGKCCVKMRCLNLCVEDIYVNMTFAK